MTLEPGETLNSASSQILLISLADIYISSCPVSTLRRAMVKMLLAFSLASAWSVDSGTLVLMVLWTSLAPGISFQVLRNTFRSEIGGIHQLVVFLYIMGFETGGGGGRDLSHASKFKVLGFGGESCKQWLL